MTIATDTFVRLQRTYGLTSRSGVIGTLIPHVRIFWSTERTNKVPTLPDMSIVLMINGRKTAHLPDRDVHYDKDNYLVVTASVPYECESTASERDPLLGVVVDVDLQALNRFAKLPGMASVGAPATPTPLGPGLHPAALSAELSDASQRLVRMLSSPSDTQALGTAIADEILYWALKGEHGPALLSLADQSSRQARIARAISWIRRDVTRPLNVSELAEVSGMSVRSFYRAFKAITSVTPLQYVKIVRLDLAMTLLRRGGRDAGSVAREVGYESGSQFSREFKRRFSASPTDPKVTGRA
ncbi:AraC family transcriptional regulator [Methylobacterium sp. CM6246]